MGHSIHKRYNMKLNKELLSYEHLISSIKNYLEECIQIEESSENPGEGYNASLKNDKGEIVISFSGYKSNAPFSLSDKILKLIKANIDTEPSKFYYYLEEEGYRNWSVSSVYGKADIVLSQYKSGKSISESDHIVMDDFKESLYEDFETSVNISDVDSIIHAIKILAQKSYALSYSHKKVNRNLIPLFRKPNGTVISAGYHFHKKEIVLYAMYKPEGWNEFRILYEDSIALVDYINSEKHTIIKNLMNPKLVSILLCSWSSGSSYTNKNTIHRHEGSIKLFDDNGPFIKIENKLDSLDIT